MSQIGGTVGTKWAKAAKSRRELLKSSPNSFQSVQFWKEQVKKKNVYKDLKR